MKINNLVITALTAAAAGALIVRGVTKNAELAGKVKEEGKKMLDDAKDLSETLREAMNETTCELRKLFDENMEKIKKEVDELKKYNETSEDSENSLENEADEADEADLEHEILKAELEEELIREELEASRIKESEEYMYDQAYGDLVEPETEDGEDEVDIDEVIRQENNYH